MAKRKTRAVRRTSPPKPRVTKQGGVVVVSQAAAPARAVARKIGKATNSASVQTRIKAAALGGAILGFIEKTFGDKIPNMPYVGRKGTVAAAVYFMKPKNKMLQDAGVAAAALSGYQLVKEGKIDGDDDGYV